MFGIDLAGRRALVTGAGRGVGRAVALAFARAGAAVVVNDIDSARAAGVVGEVTAAGGSAETGLFDVTRWDDVEGARTAIGPVDVLVNNAGNAGADAWPGLVAFTETQPADWEPFLRVNLYGVLHCTRAWLPAMTEAGWGRVITVISDAARDGEPKLAAYAAAKAGAAGFSRAVAREVGRYGVTVNCVSLGTMAPDGGEAHGRDLRGYAIRRAGRPADVAGLVTFLAGEDAAWITGQTYPVDGGLSPAL
jgi:3-oxoacyl-[acyl-carrier protein] reductase